MFSQEEQRIEELVSLMPDCRNEHGDNAQQQAKSDYGSDEDEYDQLFTEVILKEGLVDGQAGQAAKSISGNNQEMDMSLG